MTKPARGGRTDRTWINSSVSELEVVCTTAPPETYRTGMTNLGEASGRSWCDVSDIRITSRGMWWHDWKLTFQGEHVETVGQISRRLARLASEPPGPGLQPHASTTPAQDNPGIIRAMLTIRAVRAVPVEVPMKRPLGTSAAAVPSAPLLLVDLQTEEGVIGRSYLFC